MKRSARELRRPSVLRTAWPAFAMFFTLALTAVGVVAFHQSMQDYRVPVSASSYSAPTAYR
jgi:hypothetical protein